MHAGRVPEHLESETPGTENSMTLFCSSCPPSTMWVQEICHSWHTRLRESTSSVAGNKGNSYLSWMEPSLYPLGWLAAKAILWLGLSRGTPGTCIFHLSSERFGKQKNPWKMFLPVRNSWGAAVGLHFGAQRTTHSV